MWTFGVRAHPSSPPPPLPTGLMKFIKGKDNGNSPYFPSATRNSTSTDKAEAGGALILHPSLHQCTILRVFKATRKGKKSKQRFEVTPRNCIRKLPRTNPLCYMLVQLGELNVQRQWPSVYFTEREWETSLNRGLPRSNILIIYVVFNHVFSSYTNVLDKRKVFARQKSSIPTRPSL